MKALVGFHMPETPGAKSQLYWEKAVCLWAAPELLWVPVG